MRTLLEIVRGQLSQSHPRGQIRTEPGPNVTRELYHGDPNVATLAAVNSPDGASPAREKGTRMPGTTPSSLLIAIAIRHLSEVQLKTWLAVHLQAGTDWTLCSVRSIQKATDLHRSSIIEALRELVASSWIERRPTPAGSMLRIASAGPKIDEPTRPALTDWQSAVDQYMLVGNPDPPVGIPDPQPSTWSEIPTPPVEYPDHQASTCLGGADLIREHGNGRSPATGYNPSESNLGCNPVALVEPQAQPQCDPPEQLLPIAPPSAEDTSKPAPLHFLPLPVSKATMVDSLAQMSARALGDQHSERSHVVIWTHALQIDQAVNNDAASRSMLALLRELETRRNKTGKPQGAAWTCRAKSLLASKGHPLSAPRPAPQERRQ